MLSVYRQRLVNKKTLVEYCRSVVWSDIRYSKLFNLFKDQLSNFTPFRGSAPGPMQGEVSPYDPLFSAHPASSSQRQSLCGTQNNPPRSDLLKYPNLLYRSGARFCSKGRRITWLSGAARRPIKRKSAKPYFKSNGADFKVKGSRGIK